MDVNLMPVSVYRLLYHDYDLKKLTPSQLKIGTLTLTLTLLTLDIALISMCFA